jgi:hypothetical protein
MPVILSCSLHLYRADVFFAMPTKPVAKKPIPGKPQAVKPAQKNVVQKKPAPDKTKGLHLLKETPQASLFRRSLHRSLLPTKLKTLQLGSTMLGEAENELIPLVWSAGGRHGNSPEFKNGT